MGLPLYDAHPGTLFLASLRAPARPVGLAATIVKHGRCASYHIVSEQFSAGYVGVIDCRNVNGDHSR